jgi:hypothetical protein
LEGTVTSKYWPAQSDEVENRRSLISEPLPPDNVIPLPKPAHSLHAVLCDALTSNRGLLQRLELGVTAPPGEAREQVRELYVQTHRTVQVLSRCLELPELE